MVSQFAKKKTMNGKQLSQQLKNYAVKYGLNEKVVYPHSFRHRYAKNFLEKFNDIALLADLMGHESIETTRIYLRRSSLEQQEILCFFRCYFPYKIILYLYHILQVPNIVIFRKSVTFYEKLRNFLFLAFWDGL